MRSTLNTPCAGGDIPEVLVEDACSQKHGPPEFGRLRATDLPGSVFRARSGSVSGKIVP